jgi:hypothetical protein
MLTLSPIGGFADAEPVGTLAQLALRALCARDNVIGLNEALQAMGTVPLQLFAAVVEVRFSLVQNPFASPMPCVCFVAGAVICALHGVYEVCA